MTPILRTGRLVLRPLETRDAEAITRAFADWEVIRWLAAPPHPYALSDALAFIALDAPDRWAITLADDRLIGCISLGSELGYWLDPAHQGQGLMTEAARAVVADHFASSDEALVSGHFEGNSRSRGVLLKLGFENTHVARTHAHSHGSEVANQRMALTAARWREVCEGQPAHP